MSFEEKNTWVQTAITIGVLAFYAVTVLGQVGDTDVTEIDYQRTLLWTIGLSIVATIIGILVGIVSGGDDKRDQRDKDINRFAEFIAYYVLSAGALVALGLTMDETEPFWIANALFFGFGIANLTSGIVKLVAYRRGL